MSQPALSGRPVPDRRWMGAQGGRLAGNRCTEIPHGLKGMVEEIHAAGFQAGLWLAPFCVRKGLCPFPAAPDWLLKVNGAPWCCGCNWSSFYALDIDNPAVLDYLRRVFDRVLNGWGFDLVKLDFLYGAAPFGNAQPGSPDTVLWSFCAQQKAIRLRRTGDAGFGLVVGYAVVAVT